MEKRLIDILEQVAEENGTFLSPGNLKDTEMWCEAIERYVDRSQGLKGCMCSTCEHATTPVGWKIDTHMFCVKLGVPVPKIHSCEGYERR